ncbi:MAG: hypothetical protein JWP74_3851 [Marmoricola sp.]|nr:hypothetical protein [Marmoricola sp.]
MTPTPQFQLFTIGHGVDDRDALRSRLKEADILDLVDVRRYPGSRHNPHVALDALSGWVPDAGIGYKWEQRLGGRRTLPLDEPVADTWWRVKSFQAYAAHTRTDDFIAAMERASSTPRTTPASPSCAARTCGGAATDV